MNFFCIALPLAVRCTPGSILMAVISSNLLLTVISFFLRSVYSVKDSKYRILSIFPAVVLIRCLLPVELPFSRIISMPQRIVNFLGTMHTPFFWIKETGISAVTIIAAIWLAGSCIKAYGYFHPLLSGRRYVRRYTQEVTSEEPYREIVDKICNECGKKSNFRIFKVDALCIPALNGIVTPYLLLPGELNLFEDDLYYILKYQIVHYYQHSLYIKFALNLLEIFFWWNPAVYLVRRQIGFFLDIQADETITKGEKQVVCDYLNSRMRVLRFAAKERQTADKINLSAYNAELDGRFRLMMRKQEKKKFIPQYLFLAPLVFVIIVLSYRFILAGDYHSAEIETAQVEYSE